MIYTYTKLLQDQYKKLKTVTEDFTYKDVVDYHL